jgi:uncharacterized alkaline shock family protein YloU
MVIDKSTPYGAINVSMEAIANVAGEAALEVYGVVGLASKNSLRENINELLKKDDYIKGVYCKKVKNAYEVDVYVVVAYGVKITEVISELQKKVTYVLEKTFQIPFKKVNVFVQDIKEIE